MKIIFLTHPSFLPSQSMPRYASWLMEGMRKRGHEVEAWSASPAVYKFAFANALKKWAGYVDQYVLFPLQLKKKIAAGAPDTLYVFTDHALGPWVPYASGQKHLIHCHDFLAQMSALGQIAEQHTSYTGRVYQRYIRKGFRQGRNFISISENTRHDLHRLLGKEPNISAVVYNGLTRSFENTEDRQAVRASLSTVLNAPLQEGYLLHVGGNQWYKNRNGVVELYNQWRAMSSKTFPLVLAGAAPSASLREKVQASPYVKDILVLEKPSDQVISRLYAGASLFVFPSLAEGFGWPVAEAMSAGALVLTTDLAPMNEVGGHAAYYLDRLQPGSLTEWGRTGAAKIESILATGEQEQAAKREAGFDNIKRFDGEKILDEMEIIYKKVLND
ncbi:MAG: glycosyltransferase family 1 protein [Chitinophagaceae bacterium]|nr:MAG: glycosyltransferase family 1 protein [Chitinophagaceae bacterium]